MSVEAGATRTSWRSAAKDANPTTFNHAGALALRNKESRRAYLMANYGDILKEAWRKSVGLGLPDDLIAKLRPRPETSLPDTMELLGMLARWCRKPVERKTRPQAAARGAGTQEGTALRALLPKIKDNKTRGFLDEAVACAELSLSRAAIVLSWVGAVSVLYDHVVSKHLAAFNSEAIRRDPKWRPAKTADDLSRMKDYEFLQVLEAISVIGKNTKHELEMCLKLRNACGHPSSLKVGPNKVAAHVEMLALNVFCVFI